MIELCRAQSAIEPACVGVSPVKQILLAVVLIGCVAPSAFAQTEGRIGVGGALNIDVTPDDEVGVGTGFGVLLWLNPNRGGGFAGALNWFKADLSNPSGPSGEFASLRVRPLMGGVSYTIGPDRVLTSFSVVGGPSFNSVKFDHDFVHSGPVAIDADTSLAIRPGVGVRYTVHPRVGLVGYGGYLFNRPDVVYRDSAGREFQDRWRGDAIVFSVGAVYSIF